MRMKLSLVWLSPTLTRLGKKFGIDLHYYTKNSALIMLGQVVSTLRGFITGYLVARFFEQNIYSEYKFMLSVVGILGIFGLPGLAQSVTRAWSRNEAFSLHRITNQLFLVSSIGSLILLLCIPFLGHYHRESLWPLFLGASVLFPVTNIATIRFGAYIVGKAKFGLMLRATITWSILTIVSTIAVILFYHSALLMLLIGMGMPSIVYLFFARRLHPKEADAAGKNTKSIIRYGWQLTFASIPDIIAGNLDSLLITSFFGVNQLGLLAVSILIPEYVKTLIKQLLPVTFSKQAAMPDTKEGRAKLIKVVLIGMGIFILGSAVYIILCPFFIPLLFPNYDASLVIPLTSIAAATIIFNPGSLFEQYLEAQRMTKQVQYVHWGASFIYVIALFALIPTYGLIGALIARGFFRFLYTVISLWFVMHAPLREAKI